MKRNKAFARDQFLAAEADYMSQFALLGLTRAMDVLKEGNTKSPSEIKVDILKDGLKQANIRKAISAHASSPRQRAYWANRIRARANRMRLD